MKLLSIKNNITSNLKNKDYKKIATKVAVSIFRYAMLIAVGYTVLSPQCKI